VVGNCNVAIDCVRMLALTAEELAPTDTIDAAARAIVGSGLKEIVMLGRRGPVQAAFTPPELKELSELAGADLIVDPADLELDPASARELEEDRERARRNFDLLREYAPPPESKLRRIVRFQHRRSDRRRRRTRRWRPRRPVGRHHHRGAVGGEPILAGQSWAAGYKGVVLGVLFDESTGTIPNDAGRVIGAERTYAAG
jgi:ferredoxin--NADP+ reductase